jgi:hypothetical protein
VVAAAWPTPYDLATNSISDLGVTSCGSYPQLADRVGYACSPRHALMNTVFVLVGVLTSAGAVLTRAIWPPRRLTSVGVAFVVLAGVGVILVGLAPANVNLAAHAAGALLQVPGAAGPLLLGVAAWRAQRGSRPSRCCAGSSGRRPACCTSAEATLAAKHSNAATRRASRSTLQASRSLPRHALARPKAHDESSAGVSSKLTIEDLNSQDTVASKPSKPLSI